MKIHIYNVMIFSQKKSVNPVFAGGIQLSGIQPPDRIKHFIVLNLLQISMNSMTQEHKLPGNISSPCEGKQSFATVQIQIIPKSWGRVVKTSDSETVIERENVA